ncbi:MAG: hypothetical protein ABIO05_05095 [Ferruginibacter sp.]
MKKIIFILFLAAVTDVSAQNSDCLIDMKGIGRLKIGMSQEEIEKIVKQKFFLKNALDTAVSWQDSASANYKNGKVYLSFQRQYTADKVYFMYLIGIRTSSTLCKTVRAIGIGDDKSAILAAYKQDKKIIKPEYNDKGYPIKNTHRISIEADKLERRIVFHLRNKKVVTIEVSIIFNDEE